MPRYIALLRGINVGGHQVKMDHLRTLFEELEFANVGTFIASGNVIFESKAKSVSKLEVTIEKHLHAGLGFEVPAFIRTTAELADVAALQPFPPRLMNVAGSSLYIAFLKTKPTPEIWDKVLALRSEYDDFHCRDREIFWYCRGKLSESPLFKGDKFGKALKQLNTMRNATTVRKLASETADKE